MWQVSLAAEELATAAFESALSAHCLSVSRSATPAGTWSVDGLADVEPDPRALAVALALAAAAVGTAPPPFRIERLAERDWLAENRERFAPFRIGRFLIQEPDDRTPLAWGACVLRIEAAAAFGSGRHGSTEGCLRALDLLARHRVRRIIDLGCGTGILGIAAAKLWRVPVLLTDCDPRAVGVARANAKLNGVGHLLRAVVTDGWQAPAIARSGPYDLALCNILARPLKRMAQQLARNLAPGGTAVLAGLLARDGRDVLAAHHAAGLRLHRTIDVGGWRTLLLRRP